MDTRKSSISEPITDKNDLNKNADAKQNVSGERLKSEFMKVGSSPEENSDTKKSESDTPIKDCAYSAFVLSLMTGLAFGLVLACTPAARTWIRVRGGEQYMKLSLDPATQPSDLRQSVFATLTVLMAGICGHGNLPGLACLFFVYAGLPPFWTEWPQTRGFFLACLAFCTMCSAAFYFGLCHSLDVKYYRNRKDEAASWKCQPDRWPKPEHRAQEIFYSFINVAMGSLWAVSMLWLHVTCGATAVYTEATGNRYGLGLPYLTLSFVLYFLWIDCWAYVGHRLLHLPFLYKRVHKIHHRFIATSPYTALALHPAEFMLLQGGVFAWLFVVPMHLGVVAANLGYIYYFTVVDHSGILLQSSFPWQPTTKFHDDHHRLFHLNFGQSTLLFDILFNSLRTDGRKYGEDVFLDMSAGAQTAEMTRAAEKKTL